MEKEPLLKGQIDLLVLSIVARGPIHGYAIIEQLRERSRGLFDLPEGTVYPALYRLERLRLLLSEEMKVGGRTRRTYRLSAEGAAALRERRSSWKQFVRGVESVIRGSRVVDQA